MAEQRSYATLVFGVLVLLTMAASAWLVAANLMESPGHVEQIPAVSPDGSLKD